MDIVLVQVCNIYQMLSMTMLPEEGSVSLLLLHV